MIEIVLNGELARIPEGQSVLQMLSIFGLDPSRVAVELNRSLVRQREWNATMVPPGAHVEVVQFVGGG